MGRELLGHGFFYQDWHVGYEFETLTRTVTETDVMNFVGVSGMTEELFTSREYLEEHTDFGGQLVLARWYFRLLKDWSFPATMPARVLLSLGAR